MTHPKHLELPILFLKALVSSDNIEKSFDESVVDLENEGYKLIDAHKNILIAINNKEIFSIDDRKVEFNIRHGLGTYDDMSNWMNSSSVQLFPIGTWARYTLFLGDDENLYLTDFDKIARLSRDLMEGFNALLCGVNSTDIQFISQLV